MSIVLQVGQCGNQFGSQFFSTLTEVINQKKSTNNFCEEAKQRFFSEDEGKLSARAVLIDTEVKVINQTLSWVKKQPFSYRSNCSYVQKQGSANNWAMGFFEHGAVAREKVLDLVQKEAENCDYLDGFLIFMSVAGGTGSGLGAFLTEMLKDSYPSASIMNQVVWPFRRGEVAVQAYNSLLTLSHLQSYSDAIVIFENDQLYKVCAQRLSMKDISLSDMNVIACSQLSSFLLPSKSSSQFMALYGDILAHLVAHPQFKLLNLRSVPQEPPACHPYSSYTWQTLLRTLRRMVLYSSIVEEWTPRNEEPSTACKEPAVSVANLLLLRGIGAESVDSEMLCKPSLPYPSWVPETAKVKTWYHGVPIFGQQKTATLANNGQSIVPCVDAHVAKAWKMYKYKAYLQHYQECGLEADDFLDHFAKVEQIVASYKALSTT